MDTPVHSLAVQEPLITARSARATHATRDPAPPHVAASSARVHPEDKAVEHTRPAYGLTDDQRRRIADRILVDIGVDNGMYEVRRGDCRLKELPGLHPHCTAFGECSGCSLSRIRRPHARQRFRHMVVSRTARALRAGDTSGGVVYVTLGCGGLLTDFEVLLGLWREGVPIARIVAIDRAYALNAAQAVPDDYAAALDSMAAFFPRARVFSFADADEYVAAAGRRPELFGGANVFVCCDSGGAPFHETALAVLRPGACAYELSNMGSGHGAVRPPLEACVPPHLRTRPAADGAASNSSMRVLQNLLRPHSDGTGERGGAPGQQHLVELDDPHITPEFDRRERTRHEHAAAWLAENSRARAAAHGKRLFVVVYTAKPRMAVRAAPSRSAPLRGARATGDEVIVDEVGDDGWVRVSTEYDTYAGYTHFDEGGREGMWMLTAAPDVGELMREVVLDGLGREVDDDAWMPELV